MAKVLIADDALYTRQVLREILVPEGHTVVEAVDGREAVQKFQEENPDLVLLDISMPGVSGLAALKAIKALSPNAKVVIVSAMGQPSIVQEALKAGACDFLTKPFRPSQVREMVARWLSPNPSSK